MKKISILLNLLIFSGGLHAQQNDCTQYHRGRFTYTDSSNHVITVKRKKHFQVETNEHTGVWINFRITWISDCEYQLEQVGTNSKSRRKLNHTVSTSIITKSFGPAGYEYTCACKDDSKPKVSGVMKTVRN